MWAYSNFSLEKCMDGFAAQDMYMLVISSARILDFTHINASLARSSSKEKFYVCGADRAES